MKNLKIIVVIALVISAIFIMKDDKKIQENNTSVGVSTFALYDIVNHITQNTQSLFMMIPFGADIHSFEPSPKLMGKIQTSPLIFYSGAGLQPWIEDIEFKNKAIDMSNYVKLIKTDKEHHHEHKHHSEHEHHHEDGALDHHYWLDIDNMKNMTILVTQELIKLHPKNKEFYLHNKQSYIDMLDRLDKDYKKKLSQCKKDIIIVNHDAFSYLAKKYQFETLPLSGLSPDSQPDATTMIELIEHIKEDNLSTVFFESFASDKAIQSIAYDTGAAVEVLQPLGNITADEAKQNLSYEEIMRENLKKISKALECK